MSTISESLRRLTAGEISIHQVADDFRTRRWLPGEFDEVTAAHRDHRISDGAYHLLAHAAAAGAIREHSSSTGSPTSTKDCSQAGKGPRDRVESPARKGRPALSAGGTNEVG